ncbi:MAG: thioredoxin-dependent thiol peroxidase [Xanthomonadaceae bacterium]|nr:thioredoxin-dependent thiol peroxidase [Xanthomonadaceae bacterium]
MAKELKVGDKAPAFKLKNDQDEWMSLKDFSGKTLVLYFYPKDLTSGCTTESCDFNDNLPKLKKKDAVVIGVSKDSVASHVKFRDKYKFKFNLLSDPETEMCEAYGVWKEKSMYGRKYMGIERTTFIISPKGVIEKIYNKVKVPGHVDDVLSSITY